MFIVRLLMFATSVAASPFELGFCGSLHDNAWPAVVAMTHKAYESNNPILKLPGTSNFSVNWRLQFAGDSTSELEEGFKRMMGNRLPDVNHPPVNAIIGCTYSTVSGKLAGVGSFLEAVQVAYISGSPSLSNKLEYPFFLRTRGTSAGFGVGYITLVKHFGFSRAGFIYEDFNNAQGAFEGALKQAQTEGIILEGFKFFHYPDAESVKDDVWYASFSNVFSTGLRVFAMTFSGLKVPKATELAMSLKVNEALIVAWEFTAKFPSLPEETRTAFNGMMGIVSSQTGFNEVSDKMEAAWKAMTFADMRSYGIPEQWVKILEDERPEVFKESPFSTYKAHEFDAIMAVLIACQSLMDKKVSADKIQGRLLLDELYQTSFEGASGFVSFSPIVNDFGGDRAIDSSVLYQMQGAQIVELAKMGVTIDFGSTPIQFHDGGSNPRIFDPVEVVSDCPAGQVPSSDSTFCVDCPAGTARADGQKGCQICSPGHFSASKGAIKCQRCAQGSYQNENGKNGCKACDMIAGSSTNIEAATSESDCQCPVDTYKANETGTARCISCPKGIKCDKFGGMPLVKEGYFMYPSASRFAEELDVYQCMPSISEICPGQREAITDPVCAQHMADLNCGLCVDGYTRAGNTCEPCNEYNWIFPIVLVCLFFLCGFFHGMWNRKAAHVEAGEMVLASVTLGLTLGFIQQMGIFDRLRFSWPGEFTAIMDFLSLFLFELDIMAPTCTLPQGLATSYVLSMLVPVFLVGAFLVWIPISRLLKTISVGRIPAFHLPEILNSVGMVIQAVFISIAASTVKLLECYESPNQVMTIRRYPYAECGGDEQLKLVPVCVLGFVFYIFGILGLFCWAAYVAPKRFVDTNFRTAIRFLVFKYCPNKWWYGIFLLVRSLMFAMITVIEPQDAYIQFFLMLGTLIFSLVVHLILLPFSDEFANNLEAAELCIMLAILGAGSWFITDKNPEIEDDLAGILVALFILCAVLLLGVFMYACFIAQFPEKARAMRAREIQNVLPRLKAMANLMTSKDENIIVDMLSKATYLDRAHVYEMVSLMLLELEGVQSKDFKSMRLPHVATSVEIVSSKELTRKMSVISVDSLDDKEDQEDPKIEPPESECGTQDI